MSESFSERRKYFRIYRNFIMFYHEKGKSATKHSVSQVNNISKGGVNFTSSFPIKISSVVIIDLTTPFIADSIRLEGMVLECREKVSGVLYEVRIQFQEVSEHVLSVLEKIENFAKSKKDNEI